MKYKKLDKKTRNRIFDSFSSLHIWVSKFRKNGECQREVFVRRTFNKYFSKKYFAFIHYEKTGVLSFNEEYKEVEEIIIPVKRYIYIYKIRNSNTMSGQAKVDLDVCFAHSALPIECVTFHLLDFLDLEFKEITEKKFKSVRTLFEDDRGKDLTNSD